jgi:AraC family transcriptional regulator of adaptative response / DNA-3-methyladenine glycosylase II
MPFEGPLDWDGMLAYFERRAVAGVEHVADGAYRRTIVVDGQPGVLELRRGGDDHLTLTAHLPSVAGLIHVTERARLIFALDRDPRPANVHLQDDPVLGPLVRSRPGMRVPGTWDPLETGVRAIIGQQVSVKGASTVMARLVERVGRPVPGLEVLGLHHTFPDAATLADADLGQIGMPTARVAAISTFAAAVAQGEVALDGSMGLDELVGALCALRGIGPWTAHYLALRIGELDAIPEADLGLRKAVDPPDLVSAARVAERAEAWRPWRGHAAIRLWSADDAA